MANTALASQSSVEPRKAVAWAVGLILSPFPGSAGVSASAWIISYDHWLTPVHPVAIPSLEADQNNWIANIRAITGVVRSLMPGETVDIFVRQKEFEALFRNRWRKQSGKTASGWEEAEKSYEIIRAKGLTVRVLYREADEISRMTSSEARARAEERYASLSDQQLMSAPPFKRTSIRNRVHRGFPAIRGGRTEA